jgi:prephenate dehydrogenase
VTKARPDAVVGVIGLGQIGGSIARALLAGGGREVLGFDIDPATVRAAASDGVVVMPDVQSLVRRSKMVALAVPLSSYAAVGALLLQCSPSSRLLFDVGSSSLPFRQLAKAVGPTTDFRFVGSHPMAGTERQGYAASDASLFRGCTWAVLREVQTRAIDVLNVATLAIQLGARSLITAPEPHDNAVARVSHLPHLLAMSLTLSALEDGNRHLNVQMAAGSFRDGTRVAASDPALVASMCGMNAAALRQALCDCKRWLDRADSALEASDAGLLTLFSQAHGARGGLPAKGEDALRTRQAVAASSADELVALLAALGEEGGRICSIASPPSEEDRPSWSALVETP